MSPKIVAVIQARMNSERLQGKSLLGLEGKPMLERVVERVKRAYKLDDLVVATTTNEKDNAIADLCFSKGWVCHRGVEGKVLGQFYDIAISQRLDAAVRITGDCPLIDAGLMDDVVDKFLEYYPDIDYASNILPRTYPRGLDVEVIKFSALEKEWRESEKWRNHVTVSLRKNYWNYRTRNVANDGNYSYMRWCVDTAEDFGFARKVYRHFGDGIFNWMDVIRLLEKHEDWVIMDYQKDPN